MAVTHAHGDHCLGLPGVLQRRVFDGVLTPVEVHAPADAVPRLQQLVGATHHGGPEVAQWCAEPSPPDPTADRGEWLEARELDHRVPCVGYRWQEPDGHSVVPERLAARGISGADVGRLLRDGQLEVGGRTVRREEVTVPRPGQSVAFVLDTRACETAVQLSLGVDLLVIEATYLDRDRDLAQRYGHLTAAQAARIGAESGARRVVLVHVSQRYGDDPAAVEAEFLAEASRWHDDVVMPRDLDVVDVPARATPRPV